MSDKVKDFSGFIMLKKLKIKFFVTVMNAFEGSNVEQSDGIEEDQEDCHRTHPSQK